MHDSLRPPALSEGFDEVLRVEPGSESQREAALERLWGLCGDAPT